METGPGQVEPLAGVFAVTWRVWGGLCMMKVASSPHARQRRVHGSSALGSDFSSVLSSERNRRRRRVDWDSPVKRCQHAAARGGRLQRWARDRDESSPGTGTMSPADAFWRNISVDSSLWRFAVIFCGALKSQFLTRGLEEGASCGMDL